VNGCVPRASWTTFDWTLCHVCGGRPRGCRPVCLSHKAVGWVGCLWNCFTIELPDELLDLMILCSFFINYASSMNLVRLRLLLHLIKSARRATGQNMHKCLVHALYVLYRPSYLHSWPTASEKTDKDLIDCLAFAVWCKMFLLLESCALFNIPTRCRIFLQKK